MWQVIRCRFYYLGSCQLFQPESFQKLDPFAGPAVVFLKNLSSRQTVAGAMAGFCWFWPAKSAASRLPAS